MELKDKFSEWYSVVVPDFTAEQLAARLESIEICSKELKTESISNLIRMFYQLPTDGEYVSSVRRVLKEKDVKYVSNDAAELAVIAGGIIASAVRQPSETADAVALSISTAEARGLRHATRIEDVVSECIAYLSKEAVRVREEIGPIPDFPAKSLAAAIAKAKEKATDVLTYATTMEEQLNSIVVTVQRQFGKIAETISAIETRRREESNVLYWILGQSTISDRVPYSTLDGRQAAILAGFELASITESLPGLAASKSFLGRMIGKAEPNTTTIPAAANELSAERRKLVLAGIRVPDPILAPVLFALTKSEEAGGDAGWHAAYAKQTNLDNEAQITKLDLADQFYSELLLVRALS